MGAQTCKQCLGELEQDNNVNFNVLDGLKEDDPKYNIRGVNNINSWSQNVNQLTTTHQSGYNAHNQDKNKFSQNPLRDAAQPKPTADKDNLNFNPYANPRDEILFNPDGRNFMSQSSVKELEMLDISAIDHKPQDFRGD